MKIAIHFLIIGIITLVAFTLSYARWVDCPETIEQVTIHFESPLPERGTYTYTIPARLANSANKLYAPYTHDHNFHATLSDMCVCLDIFDLWVAYEYGAKIIAVWADGIQLDEVRIREGYNYVDSYPFIETAKLARR